MATNTTRFAWSKPDAGDNVSAFQGTIDTTLDSVDLNIVGFQGAYAGGTTYHQFDVVSSSGIYYMSTTTQTGAAPPGATWVAWKVSLAPLSGNIGSDVAITANTLTKIFDTASLAIGTWLVTATLTMTSATGGAISEVHLVVDTATATLTGSLAAEVVHGSPGAGTITVTLNAVVVVTVAGTIMAQVFCNQAATARAATNSTSAFAGATGWTALPVR